MAGLLLYSIVMILTKAEVALRRVQMEPQFRAHLKMRLFAKLDMPDENACWEWTGGRTIKGYGSMMIDAPNNARTVCHRIAYVLRYGNIPDGLNVLHRCDNPPCCNPAHLFVGTQLENMRDMVAKNRQAHFGGGIRAGSKNSAAVYSEDQAIEAVRLSKLGLKATEIAAALNVSRQFVDKVRTGRLWSHATGYRYPDNVMDLRALITRGPNRNKRRAT